MQQETVVGWDSGFISLYFRPLPPPPHLHTPCHQVLLPEVAPFCELALSASCENREAVLLCATEVVLQTSTSWRVHTNPSDDGNDSSVGGSNSETICFEVLLNDSSNKNVSESMLVGLLKEAIRTAVAGLTSGHIPLSVVQTTWCALVCSPCCR